ncbi:TlpA disulfide reductase family protein [Bdellovibrio sp. NC01]|uniref:TlpA family protein disulfide reductase n=1 Tax=Bdellovibrio sp. NC01 TaxID=2220073 RepID=UPI001158C568|nr:TlpA disulfide reductase family protein [Bdellovibrio sp. NC01]QDK38789.1 TlpA family protein disulfide reductase [Bdellovibrio sp. NC01]
MKQHLKAFALVVVLGVLAVLGFNYFFLPKVQEAPTAMATVESMEKNGVPNFSAETLSGEKFDLESLKGKVVILNFWASWCGPCVEEVPSLIKLVKEFKGDVQLIAISGDSSVEDINIFLKSFPELKGENIKIVYDQDRSKMKMFDVARLPESMVLSKDHKLAKKLVGSINWYNEDSIAYMKTLLK